jgi:hypothetical protein
MSLFENRTVINTLAGSLGVATTARTRDPPCGRKVDVPAEVANPEH